MADILRDSQITVEVLLTDGDPQMRNSQVAVEVLLTDGDPQMRNSQVSIEVLEKIPYPVRNMGLIIIA
jgi:hypothetical protein